MHFRSGNRTIRGVADAQGVSSLARLLALLLLLAGGGSGCRSATEVDFNADIRPVLNDKCVVCHGGVRRRANLSLLFRDDALRPAKSGKPAIVPGNPAASELIRRVADHNPEDRMPKEMEPLTEDEIDTFRRWIAEGADWSPHWAYVAPERPHVPSTDAAGWARNPVDAFVFARLEREGLRPSPEADCPVLVRRVSLDLIGLPPSPKDVRQVCGGSVEVDGRRYMAYVDSLLASPRFGERWAAMWLDLARYADSQGYEKDGPRSIWRYRDWVVTAFNSDMPFDQFTVEQLAGDLLPNASCQQKLATAFHRNAMTNTEGGTDDEEHRVAAVIDRVNTTFEVWQSTSAGCAQCHGHPFDPLRHEEYYQLFAFFNNTPDWDQPDEYPVAREFEPEDSTAARAILARLERVAVELDSLAQTPDLLAAHAKWETELDDPKVVGSVVNTWQNELLRVVKIPAADRTPAQSAYARRMFVETQPQFEELRKERRSINGELAALNPIVTPVLEELPADTRRETHVFERGNFLLPTTRVDPGIPAFLPQPDEQPRTRLDLANWLMSDENPLTSRVIVNRFWEQLFGLGIVETLEDFGTEGSTPTHAELLDWLAVEFRDEMDWGVKTLLRTLVASATYRQSSSFTPELLERDPRNLLLARAGSRPGPRGRRTVERKDVRAECDAAAARRYLAESVQQRQVDYARGRRPIPSRTVHLLATDGAVSFDDYV